jgi:DNA-directed RNA polymerase specialized sigma24 family protein
MDDELRWAPGASSAFPPTRLSLLERVRDRAPDVRRQAFGDLVVAYWKPAYKYLRLRWRLLPEDAEDVTQGFFAVAFEKEYLAGFDPAKGRFRTFLRVCLDRFAHKAHKARQAQKRGGGARVLSLDFAGAEGELRALDPADPKDLDHFFRQEMVRELFARALADVREALDAEGKQVQFRVFERYDLEPSDALTYGDLATEFGIPVTQVTNYLAAVRRRFRERALAHLRAASGTDEEFHADARELFGIDVA